MFSSAVSKVKRVVERVEKKVEEVKGGFHYKRQLASVRREEDRKRRERDREARQKKVETDRAERRHQVELERVARREEKRKREERWQRDMDKMLVEIRKEKERVKMVLKKSWKRKGKEAVQLRSCMKREGEKKMRQWRRKKKVHWPGTGAVSWVRLFEKVEVERHGELWWGVSEIEETDIYLGRVVAFAEGDGSVEVREYEKWDGKWDELWWTDDEADRNREEVDAEQAESF